MQEKISNKYSSNIENEIDLREIVDAIFKGKWIIVSITTFASVLGVIYSLYLPNIYESKAILFPAESSNGISGALQNYSNLAGLAGINLPASETDSNSKKAIKKLTSLSFFEDNVMPEIFLPDLMAIKSWDNKANKLIYDHRIYNITSNAWVREYSYPQTQVPSAQESYKVFRDIININEDSRTGFVTLTIKHQSPSIAKDWAELVIKKINAFFREKDKLESQKAVDYLNTQIAKTNFSEIKQVMAQLVQQEIQKLTLIEAKEFYVFDYIDPPALMEEKSEPLRYMICILAALFGGILGIFITLFRHYRLKDMSAEI